MKKTIIVILSVFTLLGCDKKEPAKAQAPGPPPEVVKFPANAAHASFRYYDGDGQLVTVRDRDEVPTAAAGYVAVTVGEKTPVVEDKLYVIDEAETDDRVAVARLTEAKVVREEGSAAWGAVNTALEVWEGSVVAAGGQPPPPRQKHAPPTPRPEDKGQIVIEGVTDGRGQFRRNQPRRGSSNRKSGEWKSVVMYWGFPCRYCIRAKNWMRDNGVKYREVNIEHNDAAKEKFLSLVRRNSGQREKYPTFVIGGSSFMQGWNESEFRRKAKR